MIFIKILVEGPTEQAFVAMVLRPYLLARDIYPTSVVLNTKLTDIGKSYKGGVSNYHKVKRDLRPLLFDSSNALVTTMLDYYGLPKDFPGYDDRPSGTCFERVEYLENQFRADINHSKFLPYLSLHEFESILFTSPQIIANQFPSQKPLDDLLKIQRAFDSPEEINDEQPPSKRLLSTINDYKKIEHGTTIANQIGLESIRQQCPHFHAWLTQLEKLTEQN